MLLSVKLIDSSAFIYVTFYFLEAISWAFFINSVVSIVF